MMSVTKIMRESKIHMTAGNRKLKKGKLIVIEGTDGSGKTTQFDLLLNHLKKSGYAVATLKFPQYGQKSAGMVEEYLNGKYGMKPTDVSPYAASLFYAIDRFDAAAKIRMWLAEDKIVFLDRYVDSNAGHQGGKIKNLGQRKKFLHWLYDLEYCILGVPKPDMVIISHVPASMNQKLLAQKEKNTYLKKGKRDIHEKDKRHLADTEHSYLWLAKMHPKNHRVIECVEQNRLLPPEEIHEKIWDIIKRVLK